MLIITGTYKIKPGRRDEFLKTVVDQGIYAAFLKEKGNISYDYFFPYGSDDDVFFFERWEDMDTWEAHKASDHTMKLQPIKEEFLAGFTPGIIGTVEI